MSETPRWDDDGNPENLEAAAEDALEWLQFLQSRGAVRKLLAVSQEEAISMDMRACIATLRASLADLSACLAALKSFLPEPGAAVFLPEPPKKEAAP